MFNKLKGRVNLGNLAELFTHSDEVKLWLCILKVLVDYWGLLVSSSTLTNEGSKSVSISDAGWLLNRTRDIVVGVAKFVSQQLNLVWRTSNCVIDDSEPCRSSHALTSSHRHQVEFIGVSVCDCLVNDCTCLRVLEAVRVTSEDPRIDSLASIDVHKLARVRETLLGQRLLYLFDLRDTDSLNLTFSNSITIEDNLAWVTTILSLEGIQCLDHS